MILGIGNCYTQLEAATPNEVFWVRGFLSYETIERGFRGIVKSKKIHTLVDEATLAFPSGLLPKLYQAAKDAGMKILVFDRRIKPCEANPGWNQLAFLQDPDRGPVQRTAIEAVLKRSRGVIKASTGFGKCLGRGTPVLLFDGSILPVEEIQPGMLLMGPDSTPRKVQTCTQGHGPLRLIVPRKGTPWVCNDAHFLTLIHTITNKCIDVPVFEYETKCTSFKHVYKQFAVGVNFINKEAPPIDPYFLGVWYGDGSKALHDIRVSKPDPEIKQVMQATADAWGLLLREHLYPKKCPTYRIVNYPGAGNPLLTALRKLTQRDHLPKSYLRGTKQTRLALLAGLLDTDGYLGNGCFEIIQKQRGIAEDILFLSRSLGLYAHLTEKKIPYYGSYWRVSISGHTEIIPTRIPRKQAPPRQQKKDVTRTGIQIIPIGDGDYFGFTLDGDGRFLLGDFTVTHNTQTAIGLAMALPCRWVFLVDEIGLLSQTAKRFNNFNGTGELAGMIGDEAWDVRRFTVATYQTVMSPSRYREAAKLFMDTDGIICDEVHTVGAPRTYQCAMSFINAYYRVGLSATPFNRADHGNLLVEGAIGRIIYEVGVRELVPVNVVVMPEVYMIPHHKLTTRKTYDGAYKECIISGTGRNALLTGLAKRVAKPALLFVKAIEHGEELLKRLIKAGVRARFLYGDYSVEEREAVTAQLFNNKLDVIIVNRIFHKGIDITTLRSVIIGSGGKSVIDSLQRVGRGMRVAPGKENVKIYDIWDQGCSWFNKHSQERREAYLSAHFPVHVLPTIEDARSLFSTPAVQVP